MALSVAAIAGEMAMEFTSAVLKLGDGSWISVQADKPSYYAGEVLTGKVIAHIVTPQRCDKVVVKVKCKEKVAWDEEHVRTITEGEGEHARTRTVYDHSHHSAKENVFKDMIIVSQLDHVLPPGEWQYPFSYTLRPDLPGVMKYKKKSNASDPAWRSADRQLETHAQVVYSLKAELETAGFFAKELKAKNEIVVNSFFDWSKVTPQHAEAHGQVMLCCCIPRGMVHLIADFDKAAYCAGETAQIRAQIKNESKVDISRMVVRLNRIIRLQDQHMSHSRVLHDQAAFGSFDGVIEAGKAAVRDLPLTLRSGAGMFIPSVKSKRVTVEYRLDVECDVPWAPDIEAHLPVTIFQPAPAVWVPAAMPGVAAPYGMPGAGAAAMPMATPMPDPSGAYGMYNPAGMAK